MNSPNYLVKAQAAVSGLTVFSRDANAPVNWISR
jgi:hypothetical protein